MFVYSLLALLFCLLSPTLCQDVPYVKIPNLGGVRGYYMTSGEKRQYEAFEGIPYAQPPVGERRFEPPEPASAWTRDINATALSNCCTQYDSLNPNGRLLIGEEDCLYLNVYTPKSDDNASLPVIFWIHGGGFQYGIGGEVGAKFLSDQDLILVTFNYRVGPFGFLSTNDEVVPGNMGLKDQTLALRWVSENIRHFGGDPKRITLTGVSAGGASVHYHYLSPSSSGLFRNGISFSGTALARWAFASDTSSATKSLAEAFRCPTNTSLDTIKCLKLIPANDITRTISEQLSDLYFSYVLFPPVAEKVSKNYFINDTPKNILENGKAYDAPWIAGAVSEEGLYVTAGFALNETMMELTEKNWKTIAPYMLHYKYTIPSDKQAEIAELSKKFYLESRTLTTDRKTVRDLTLLVGDDQITANTVRAVKLQAKVSKSPVRMYYYSYRAAQSLSDFLSGTTEDLGVSHADDCYLVVNSTVIDPTTRQEDRAMLKDMLRFWKSFASEGEPDIGIEWPKLDGAAQDFQFMHMKGPENYKMEVDNNLGKILFWDRLKV